ncbi:hypothetical protein PHISCL_07284 [Aspergillus sclerotialis]|uniref:Uncharacterized protein n=1 Tax=Aspergillus sclerotialis TaxID=2070753 RepID=A0A3A2ZB61_9EURO|nr:hypothetical protein PHISCL_07284 [Aspergillus sclerotialis]
MNVFRYVRWLTDELKTGTEHEVTIRINTHYGINESGDTGRSEKATARLERFLRCQDMILDFKKSPCIAWEAYYSPNAKPMTKWGGFCSRKLINQDGLSPAPTGREADDGFEESGIIRYPAQVSFEDLEEAAIILAYGAFLEWKREKEIHDSISRMNHKVGFLDVAGRGIMAVMIYSAPDTEIAKSFRTKEASYAKICYLPPKSARGHYLKCHAIAIPNIFGLPYDNPLFLIKTKSLTFFQTFSVKPGQPLKLLHARVHFRTSHIGAKRQVEAVNLITGMAPEAEFARPWQKVLLNQSRGARPVVDPLASIDPSHTKFDAELRKIQDTISLSEDQLNCLKSCTGFPDGCWSYKASPVLERHLYWR